MNSAITNSNNNPDNFTMWRSATRRRKLHLKPMPKPTPSFMTRASGFISTAMLGMRDIPITTTNSLLLIVVLCIISRLVSWFQHRIRFIRMVNKLPGPSVNNHKYPVTADLGPIFGAPNVTVSEGVAIPDVAHIFLGLTKEFHEKGHGLVRQWGFHPYHTPIAQSFIMVMDPYCIMDILKQTATTASTSNARTKSTKSTTSSKSRRAEPAFEKPLDEAYRGVLPLLGPSIVTLPDGHPRLKLQRKAGTPTSTIISHAHNSTRHLVQDYLFPFWDQQAKKRQSASPSASTSPHAGLDLFVQAKHLTVDIAGMITVSRTFGAVKALRDGNKAGMYHDIQYLDSEAANRCRDPTRSITHFSKFNQALDRVNTFMMSSVAARKKNLALQAAGSTASNKHQRDMYNQDLLSGLLKAEGKMDDGYLLGNLRLFLYGAYNSTASVLTWALWEIAKNPEYQRRLYEEEIKPLGPQPAHHELCKCTFLNQIINETLRLYAPTSITRRATRDVTIGRGDKSYTIPKGSSVFVFPLTVNRLSTPDNPDADKFIPEREINKKACTMKDDAHARNLAFSLAPRHCIGSPLALTEIRTSLATILYSFKITPTKNAPEPKLLLNLNFNPHNVYVDFARREK